MVECDGGGCAGGTGDGSCWLTRLMLWCLVVILQVWGSVMPLSFFPAYCGIVLLSAAAVQKLFVVRGTQNALRKQCCFALRCVWMQSCACTLEQLCTIAGPAPWQLLCMHPEGLFMLACVPLQENKKVQEISGNITKSISAAF